MQEIEQQLLTSQNQLHKCRQEFQAAQTKLDELEQQALTDSRNVHQQHQQEKTQLNEHIRRSEALAARRQQEAADIDRGLGEKQSMWNKVKQSLQDDLKQAEERAVAARAARALEDASWTTQVEARDATIKQLRIEISETAAVSEAKQVETDGLECEVATMQSHVAEAEARLAAGQRLESNAVLECPACALAAEQLQVKDAEVEASKAAWETTENELSEQLQKVERALSVEKSRSAQQQLDAEVSAQALQDADARAEAAEAVAHEQLSRVQEALGEAVSTAEDLSRSEARAEAATAAAQEETAAAQEELLVVKARCTEAEAEAIAAQPPTHSEDCVPTTAGTVHNTTAEVPPVDQSQTSGSVAAETLGSVAAEVLRVKLAAIECAHQLGLYRQLEIDTVDTTLRDQATAAKQTRIELAHIHREELATGVSRARSESQHEWQAEKNKVFELQTELAELQVQETKVSELESQVADLKKQLNDTIKFSKEAAEEHRRAMLGLNNKEAAEEHSRAMAALKKRTARDAELAAEALALSRASAQEFRTSALATQAQLREQLAIVEAKCEVAIDEAARAVEDLTSMQQWTVAFMAAIACILFALWYFQATEVYL